MRPLQQMLILLALQICGQVPGQDLHSFQLVSHPVLPGIEQVLSRYIQFPSVSGHEQQAGVWLQQVCQENGLEITQMGNRDNGYNFAASLYPLSRGLPNIVFLNHIDVVPSGDSAAWTEPPFSGRITETEIWGRGAFDNKGAAIMQLFSLLEIRQKYAGTELPYNLTFLAVSCEETQCEGGAKYVVENYLGLLNPAVIIGEGATGIAGVLDETCPTPMFGISVAHKRALWLELELGVETSGHGSITPISYANQEMVRSLHRCLKKKTKIIYNDLNVSILKRLGHLHSGVKGFCLRHPRLFKGLLKPHLRQKPELLALFSNTVTLTCIDSHNDVINVIPESITARLDCRLLPSESSERFLNRLTKRLGNDGIHLSVMQSMPEMIPTATQTLYYGSLESAIKTTYPESEVLPIFLPNFNDVGVFRSAGVPAYATIPVILDKQYLRQIHHANERIPIAVLEKGKETYVQFFETLLQKPFVYSPQIGKK